MNKDFIQMRKRLIQTKSVMSARTENRKWLEWKKTHPGYRPHVVQIILNDQRLTSIRKSDKTAAWNFRGWKKGEKRWRWKKRCSQKCLLKNRYFLSSQKLAVEGTAVVCDMRRQRIDFLLPFFSYSCRTWSHRREAKMLSQGWGGGGVG